MTNAIMYNVLCEILKYVLWKLIQSRKASKIQQMGRMDGAGTRWIKLSGSIEYMEQEIWIKREGFLL